MTRTQRLEALLHLERRKARATAGHIAALKQILAAMEEGAGQLELTIKLQHELIRKLGVDLPGNTTTH